MLSVLMILDPILCRFNGTDMKVGDARLQQTHAQHLERARSVEAQLSDATSAAAKEAIVKQNGCHGRSILIALVPYLDYNTFFTVPPMHALMFGVVSSFVKHILRKPTDMPDDASHIVSNANKKIIQQRAADVIVTAYFGRKYKDVVQYNASYTMEEWTHFTLTISHYIFRGDVLTPELKELWDLLVFAVAHYCQRADHRFAYSVSASEAAAKALRDYAIKLEKFAFPPPMFSFNLHIVVCRLGQQEKARGAASKDLELTVEREVQGFKTTVDRRVCKDPEKVYANVQLQMSALEEFEKANPEMRSFEELCGRAPKAESKRSEFAFRGT